MLALRRNARQVVVANKQLDQPAQEFQEQGEQLLGQFMHTAGIMQRWDFELRAPAA